MKRVIILLALFAGLTNVYARDCSQLLLWQANEVYVGSMSVQYNNNAYTANYWTRNNNPETHSTHPWDHWRGDGECTDVGSINQLPNAVPNGPYTATPRATIHFSSQGSTDPDGNIVRYLWEFGDGSRSELADPDHAFVSEGSYTVRLTVTDDKGAMASNSTSAYINNDSLETPMSINGQLRVCGTQLCNQSGKPIQLRGVSTHGLQWFGWEDCINESSLDSIAQDWGADIVRISLYVQEGGYESNPAFFTQQVNRIIDEVTERGMYALVDWHQLSPGDPSFNLDNAIAFFSDIAGAHKDKNNVIYDIANEPNGVSWNRIKNYADQIIPIIRSTHTEAPILVGTHGWASLGVSDGRSARDIIDNPLSFENIMYTFHFYAASHNEPWLNELDWASDRLPVFVTEFGTQQYDGDGVNDFAMSQRYLNLMQAKKIGWTNWNFSDDWRSGAVLVPGTCPNGPWTGNGLKPSGQWIKERLLDPPDSF